MKRLFFSFVLMGGVLVCAAESPRVFPKGKLPDDIRLKPLKDLNGHFPFKVPATLEAWKKRKAELQMRVQVATGLYPMPARTPLNAVIHGKVKRPGFTAEKVYFESVPGFYVTGILFRPEKAKGKLPAILCPHGHGGRLQMHSEAKVLDEIKNWCRKIQGIGSYAQGSPVGYLGTFG